MKLQSRNKVSTQFSMSSMTDLVFLLLIFFIIVSTLISPYAIPVDLPSSKSETTTEPRRIVVDIDAELVHRIDGKVVDAENLAPAMQAAFDKLGAPQKSQKPSVVLKVDDTVDSEQLVNVLVIAKRNEWGIAIAKRAE